VYLPDCFLLKKDGLKETKELKLLFSDEAVDLAGCAETD
jgi:hypothetical protein